MDYNATRVQFDLPKERLKALEELMRVSGLATRKELISNALALFEWAVRERQLGRRIASIDDELMSREVMLPALENALAQARERPVAAVADAD